MSSFFQQRQRAGKSPIRRELRQAPVLRRTLVQLGMVLFCSHAHAQDAPPAETRATAPSVSAEDTIKKVARELAWQGVEQYEAGDFGAASESFLRAYQLQRVPTVGLWLARALKAQRKWVEASERYMEVVRMKPEDGAQVHVDAQREAKKEYEALQPQLPHLLLRIMGARPGQARIKLDGAVLPQAVLGVPVPVNPGKHELNATKGTVTEQRFITLSPSELQEVRLDLTTQESRAATGSPLPAGEAEKHPEAHYDSDATGNDSSSLPTESWVGFGVGLAGLGAGMTLGTLALGKLDDAEKLCPANTCTTRTGQKAHADYNDLRIGSLIGYGVGILGIASGLTLWLLHDGETAAAQATQVKLGPSGFSVLGRF